MNAYGITDSGSRVPAVRADSIVPGDSLVERDGYLLEVASADKTFMVLNGMSLPAGSPPYVILTFRSFGPSRVSPKTYRGDALVCVLRKAS